MWPSSTLTVSAAVAVLLYAAAAFLLMGGVRSGVGLILWTTSPLVLPLLVVAFSHKPRTRWLATLLLASLWAGGLLLLLWGLVLAPGHDHHLVVVFLPIHMFAVLAAVAAAVGVLAAVRAILRFVVD